MWSVKNWNSKLNFWLRPIVRWFVFHLEKSVHHLKRWNVDSGRIKTKNLSFEPLFIQSQSIFTNLNNFRIGKNPFAVTCTFDTVTHSATSSKFDELFASVQNHCAATKANLFDRGPLKGLEMHDIVIEAHSTRPTQEIVACEQPPVHRPNLPRDSQKVETKSRRWSSLNSNRTLFNWLNSFCIFLRVCPRFWNQLFLFVSFSFFFCLGFSLKINSLNIVFVLFNVF